MKHIKLRSYLLDADRRYSWWNGRYMYLMVIRDVGAGVESWCSVYPGLEVNLVTM